MKYPDPAVLPIPLKKIMPDAITDFSEVKTIYAKTYNDDSG